MHASANQSATSHSDIAHLSARIADLEAENRWLKQRLFGRSSEKRETPVPANQPWLFNEADALVPASAEPASITVPAHTRKKPGRKPITADLPRVEVIHDLSEAEKICPKDGARLAAIGEEVSEQVEFIPAKAHVLRHIRLKYACPCCKSHVALASLPVLAAAPSALGTARWVTPSLLSAGFFGSVIGNSLLKSHRPHTAAQGA
jgi:hypothetical protein